MTPTLKAMLEAMAHEIQCQASVNHFHADGPGTMSRFGIEGVVDLEKVARAGLEAIREPTDEMVASGSVDYAATSSTRRVWRGMVDVALTGEPSSLDHTRDAILKDHQ